MATPVKTSPDGDDWRYAILPNPFSISVDTHADSPRAATVSPESASQSLQPQTPEPVLEENTRGLLTDYLPNFGGELLPQPIAILDGYDEPQTSLQTATQLRQAEADLGAVTLPKEGRQLRGIGLIGAVFNVLSKQLGTEYSTAELMLAAQQLIDISKAEYVGIPYKNATERAGYYSWDLVRAFGSHQWQIARVETNRMDHCDTDEFSPESFENAKLLLHGWNERTWEF